MSSVFASFTTAELQKALQVVLAHPNSSAWIDYTKALVNEIAARDAA